jgi:hypothetical protein
MQQTIQKKLTIDYLNRRDQALDPESVTMPNVHITGQHFQVTGPKLIVSTLVGYVRLACFALLFFGDYIMASVGGPTNLPQVVREGYEWMKENKMQFGFGAFFIGSMI